MEGPIFIVGANRSGTTLLRLILNSHSRIAIPDELIYFDSYLAGVPIKKWRNPGISRERYGRFVDQFLDDRCEPVSGLNRQCVRAEILNGPADFRRPYQVVLESWAAQQGKARWGEKTPGNLFYVDYILEMFPSAQFIYMVRDPRAGVASMQNVSFFPEDAVFNALNRRKHATDGRNLLKRHVPSEQRMVLRYEDLVRDPTTVIRKVCDFLGETFEYSMLEFHRDADSYMKREAASSYNAAATRPISDEHIDRWRSKLRPKDIALIEKICAAEMREFSYTSSGLPLPLRGRIELFVKERYWTWQMKEFNRTRHHTVKHRMFDRTRARVRQLVAG